MIENFPKYVLIKKLYHEIVQIVMIFYVLQQ